MIKKLSLLLALISPGLSSAATLFSEDFEGFGLGYLNPASSANWLVNRNGTVVNDPLQSDQALSFTALFGGGDLESRVISSTTGTFNISFDYLGTCTSGDCGGFFWNSVTGWDGTSTGGGVYRDTLIDDGNWNTYSFNVSASSLTIELEDWIGSSGVPGDAFFDNIVITDGRLPSAIPVPAAVWLFGSAVVGFAGFSRFKKKS